ncbi:transmembrane amino acid transporter protein [Skeletonema marinoi]|uniref:Transmembrane amino acid transporter protein n=1 Tax=Skeletonema marinoi TaxID=267567 RepID=A0AAD8YFW6_9STRA|nr:transmembrane amino acid transporter protein [Skeletonema marinoi]
MEATRLDPFNKPNRSIEHLIDIDVTMTVQSAVERSPFLRPSNPRLIKKAQQSQITKTQERKSSLLGAYTNLCNVTMGAGIVGMPYAIKEAGLVPGTVMIIICAFLTDYSLRQLISVGKVADVNSYETLMEASFGRPGFIFLSVNMFLLSLGSMIAYLIIIKDTLPVLLQVAPDDEDTKRMIMFISSLFIILPLSMQRDISDLEKTSKFNVILNTIMVSLVAGFSPIKESVSASGGIMQLLSDEKILDISTFFIGFGVCSFAFVCQDSSFIIAGSMSKPTKFRWKKVTQGAMLTCVILELTMGVSGYLAYQKNAVGNILNNMNTHHWSGVASRSILCATMFFAYPINLYIGRHACMVLFFKGVSAHEGDDARVLARRDRRIILTLVLYISSLLPAIFLEKTGNVLAATGAIGGSSLAYIGPGASFLAVWGHLFLDLVRSRWHDPSRRCYGFPRKDGQQNETAIEANEETSIGDVFFWFALGMPIWCSVARIGEKQLAAHFEREMLISPGIIKPRRVSVNPIRTGTPMVHTQLIPPSKLIPGGSLETSSLLDPNSATIYGSSQDNPQDKEMQPMDRIDSFTSVEVKIEMDKTVPTIMEFWVAIGYIILGLVAMIFGLGSIIVQH